MNPIRLLEIIMVVLVVLFIILMLIIAWNKLQRILKPKSEKEFEEEKWKYY